MAVPGLGYAVTYAGTGWGRVALILVPGILLCCLYLADIWWPRSGLVRRGR